MIEYVSKFEEITPELINKIISHLNKTNIVTWLPIIIAFFALLISAISLLKSSVSTKDNLLQNIKMNIDTAKMQYENLSMESASLAAKKNKSADENRELELKRKILESALEKVLNAYEDGCSKYFKNKVNKKDFEEKYNMDIINYIKEFPGYFKEPETHYNSMLNYNKQHYKKQ